MKIEAPLYCFYAELIPNLIIKYLIKKQKTPCILVIMEEIKPFAFVCYNDKIEHEEADEKDPENSYFSAGKPFPHFTGVHCVCPANSWEKLACLLFWRGWMKFKFFRW